MYSGWGEQLKDGLSCSLAGLTPRLQLGGGRAYLLDHAVLCTHDLDFVRVVVEFPGRGGEQVVHDGRVGHEVGPEADGERFDLLRVLGADLDQVAG